MFHFYCVKNLSLYKCYEIHLAIFFLVFFFENPHLFQKTPHIFHNILESQKEIRNICRIRDSERNEEKNIVLASKL